MVRTLTDAIRHATRLADAYTNAPLVIADDDHRAEGKAATTLDNFGNAFNIDNTLVQFLAFFIALTGRAWFTFALWL